DDTGSQIGGCLFVNLQFAVAFDQCDLVVFESRLLGSEPVKDVFEYFVGIALRWFAEATTGWDSDLDRVAGIQGATGDFGRPRFFTLAARVFHNRRVQSIVSTEGSPRQIGFMTFAFTCDHSVRQEGVFTNDADASSELTGCCRFIAQFVAVGAHWEAPFEFFNRVVAGVGDQVVGRVRTIGSLAATVGSFINFQVDPVFTLRFIPTGVGHEVDVCRVSGCDFLRNDRRQGTQREVHGTLYL